MTADMSVSGPDDDRPVPGEGFAGEASPEAPRAFCSGVMPGSDMVAAATVIEGETGDFPACALLPERGAIADGVARSLAVCEGMGFDIGPRAWQLSPRPGIAARRAADLFARDLDACEATWGSRLPQVKTQLAGPVSLAAAVETPSGHRVMTDRSATADLVGGLVHGLAEHVGALARRFDCPVTVQLNEPLLARVIAGKLSGTSDFDVIDPRPEAEVGDQLGRFVEEIVSLPHVGGVIINQAAYPPVWSVAGKTRPAVTMIDISHIRGTSQLDGMGQALSGGHRLAVGTGHPDGPSARDRAIRLARLVDELAVDPLVLARQIDVFDTDPTLGRPLTEVARSLSIVAALAGILAKDAGDL
ncbi:methionine synthase [Corynebacterium mendelii]|uniref:methionine synthase n=1 Tax=Corynebacterium mendelii TaxID=2765362 RepID=UPI00366BEC3B